ncbi:MAG TPA: proprotein convertase P-domain-containing protein [Phycisphaerales bacterium]|nr:proprotein convertase P-domain-containing protein [Phycisphaerales bacterium]
MMKSVATSLTAALSICGLSFAQAINDDCAEAIAVGSTTTTSGSQVNCNTDGLSSCSNGGFRDVWYSFTPAITGIYRLSTCGSGGDTILSVHSACPGTVQNQLACNDDNGPACVATNASLDFSFVAGQTYKVRVASYYQSFLPNFTFAVTPRFTLGACGVNVGGQTVCQLRSAAECLSVGGSYNGDNSPCNTQYGPATTYSSSPNVAIPDPGFVEDTINVSGFAGTLGHVRVNVQIAHPFVTDIYFELTHVPTGVRSLLFQRSCAILNPIPNSGLNVGIEDGVVDTFTCPNPPLAPVASGQRPPVDILAAFNGRDPNGAWTLRVTDAAGNDVGSLVAWSLELSRRTQDVFGVDNPCSADFDHTGGVTVADLFTFLDAWFTQFPGGTPGTPSADFDGDSSVTVGDLFGFLDSWFAEFGVCGQ